MKQEKRSYEPGMALKGTCHLSIGVTMPTTPASLNIDALEITARSHLSNIPPSYEKDKLDNARITKTIQKWLGFR